MIWEPLTLGELEAIMADFRAQSSAADRALFEKSRITPEKWVLSPWGDKGGGFWAIAVHGQRVLWYNDIEDGFNVSTFQSHGRIPDKGYGCSQDPLKLALNVLVGKAGRRRGRPLPLDPS